MQYYPKKVKAIADKEIMGENHGTKRYNNSNKGPNPVKLAARMHDFTDLRGAFISSKKKPSMRDKREIKDLNRCLKNSYVYDDTFFEVKKTESNFIVAQKR